MKTHTNEVLANQGAGRGNDRRRGFVLAFVVMMLFAISVAGATGYLIVNSEFTMAKYSAQSSEALAVARAGLHRFAAEQMGVLGDSVSYAIGDGIVLVTVRKLMELDSLTDYYYIRAEAQVSDIFSESTPATRVVGAYGVHHRRPLAHWAAVMSTAIELSVYDKADIKGKDHDKSDDCEGGDADEITGGIARTTVTEQSGGDLEGDPASATWSGGYSDVYDSVDLRWDVLTDPNFAVEFDDVMPNFATLASDSYPVVRYNGDLYADNSWTGRGVLIVTGQFDSGPDHQWDGIVLAGHMDDIMQGDVHGVVVSGLDGTNPYLEVEWRGKSHYHSCDVYAANESLSYLELLAGTVFEVN